jgi:hypothetical protein
MAGQNNLDRPGGLDEKQFTAKFDTRITREGKYQTKVSLPLGCCSALAACSKVARIPVADLTAQPSADRMCSRNSTPTATVSCLGSRWAASRHS